jgi:hypothetical protein
MLSFARTAGESGGFDPCGKISGAWRWVGSSTPSRNGATSSKPFPSQRAASAARAARRRSSSRWPTGWSLCRRTCAARPIAPAPIATFSFTSRSGARSAPRRFATASSITPCAKVIEPLFEAEFIADSYANRSGKGTHRALAGCSTMRDVSLRAARRCRAAFPVARPRSPARQAGARASTMRTCCGWPAVILDSGAGVLADEYTAGVLPRRRPARRLPPTRPADRQSDFAVLVERLSQRLRLVRAARTGLRRLPALRR